MGISSPGLGSNLDVSSIVSQLMAIEKQPLTQLDLKTASFQAKLSGFGTLKSVLSQFQSALNGLSDPAKFQGVKTSIGDATVASASGSPIAVPGNYSLEVSKLAQAQKLNAAGQVSSSAKIGADVTTTLSFDFGTITGGTLDPATGKYTGAAFASAGTGIKTVTIDAANNSLSGIRDAINKAAVGVTATIVNDGSGTPFRLSLTSNTTGVANSLKLSVAGDATISSLLSNDPSAGQALSQTSAAQNSQFKLDGIDITKSSNTITDALAGVTLNLTKTNVGAPTTVGITRDTTTVINSVNAFVKAYNDINQTLQDASAYDPNSRKGAILNGEASVRTIQNQIRSVLTAPISGGASAFTLLSEVGVSVQKGGALAVDATKLQKAVDTGFDGIAGLFSNVGKSSDALVGYISASTKTQAGAFAVEVSQLATKGVTKATAPFTPFVVTAGSNDTLEIKIDGLTSTITLTPGNYDTAAKFATEVQSKINGNSAFSGFTAAVITEADGSVSITSNSYGSTSHAEVIGGTAQAEALFGSGAVITNGLNVAGTINGRAAVGNGQSLVGATSDPSEGLNLLITGGSLGARGTINYSIGYAYQLNKVSTSLLASDGPINARTNGISSSIKDISKNREALVARLIQTEKRFRAQFTALDGVIAGMSKTSAFLSQQLASLSNNS